MEQNQDGNHPKVRNKYIEQNQDGNHHPKVRNKYIER